MISNLCKVKSYPVSEQWNWLWIWPGDPTLADESLIPDHFEMGLTDPAVRCAGDCYNLVPGRYMLMHDNLFDLTHINYLHLPSFGGGGGGGADQVPVHTEGPNWIESRFLQNNIDMPRYFSYLLNYEGKVNRSFGLRLYMPCLHYGADTHHRVNPDGSDGELLGSLRIFHGVTPATRTTAHYFFAAGHTWKDDNADSAKLIVDGLRPTLQEDVSATLYIEQMIPHYGGRPSELLFRADHVCARGRRFFERVIRAEMQDERRQLADIA